MPKYFIITGLPRSRTAWLAALFCTGDVICFHEPVNKFDGDLVAMKECFDGLPHKYVGISDSSMGINHEFYLEHFNEAPIVYVERNVVVVRHSLCEFLGITDAEAGDLIKSVWKGALCFHRKEGTLHVQFERLAETEEIKEIWEHCINDIPFDTVRCEVFQRLMINQHKEKILSNMNKS